MTLALFMTLFTVGSLVSSLLTEALKKALTNIPSNILALIDAFIVGGAGTAAYYLVNGIQFDVKNIVCIIFMIICVWLESMVGYDKVMQLIDQIKKIGK